MASGAGQQLPDPLAADDRIGKNYSASRDLAIEIIDENPARQLLCTSAAPETS